MKQIILSLALAALPVLSQQGIIVSAGPSIHAPIQVAPGQIVHLRLQNLRTTFDATQVADALPLPEAFGQLSVLLRQSESSPVAVPLVRGDGLGTGCDVLIPLMPGPSGRIVDCPASDSRAYDLTVQIPYELNANPSLFQRPEDIPMLNDATLTLRELGREASTIRILPVEDKIQMLSICFSQLYDQPSCTPHVYHADGKRVDASNPARSGEEVVAYAYGLGKPDSPIPSGAATPAAGIPVSRPFRVFFPGTTQPEQRARFVGLVPGQVGLYQINMVVPQLPDALPLCTETLKSNLTAMVHGSSSSDQVSFCARP